MIYIFTNSLPVELAYLNRPKSPQEWTIDNFIKILILDVYEMDALPWRNQGRTSKQITCPVVRVHEFLCEPEAFYSFVSSWNVNRMPYKRRKYHFGDTHLKKQWRTKRKTKDLDEVSIDQSLETFNHAGCLALSLYGLKLFGLRAVSRILLRAQACVG